MADKFLRVGRGEYSKFPSTIEDGRLLIATDTKKIYLDNGTARIQLGGSDITIDSALSSTSTNPVQNKAINSALNDKQDNLKLKNSSTDNSQIIVNPASTSTQILDIGMANSVISMDGSAKAISLTAGSTNLFIDDTTGISVNSKKITGVSTPTEDTDVANKQYVDNNKVTVDTALSTTSTNPVQNKAITAAINKRQEKITSETSLIFADGKMGIARLSTSDGEVDLYASGPRILTIENNDLEDTTVRGVATPSEDNDVANKKYVDDTINNTHNNGNFINGESTGSLRSIGSFEATDQNIGTYAFAEGYASTASGNYSHAEGSNTIASGNYSHAEGVSTQALGKYSHVGGGSSKANYQYSFVHGYQLNDAAENQTIFGKYNKTNANALFQIGNGASSSQSNAFEVNKDSVEVDLNLYTVTYDSDKAAIKISFK